MNDRIARAALTRLFDSQDFTGRALVQALGAHAALRVATGAQPPHTFRHIREEDLNEGLRRWAQRIPDVDAERDLATIERMGGGFLIPGDEHWPIGLDDLPDAPYGLWYIGDIAQGIPAVNRAAALTGSRDSTSYGAAVTAEMAHGLGQRGICVVSGLAPASTLTPTVAHWLASPATARQPSQSQPEA